MTVSNSKYPERPWFRKGAPETSRLAAESFVAEAKSIRENVWRFVAGRGVDGAIGDDVADALDLHVTQVRSRLSELKAAKRIVDSGKRRKGSSGRSGAVWVLPQFGPPPEDDGQSDFLAEAA